MGGVLSAARGAPQTFPPRLAAGWGMPLGVGGPPARNFIGRWAGQDTQDTQDSQDCGRVGFAPSNWPARSHWDNGRLARCVDCPWPANATRKMRVVPVGLFPAQRARCALSQWACSQREAPGRRCLGCLGCPGCLGQGAGAQSGQVPAWPPTRRQERKAAKCLPGHRPAAKSAARGAPRGLTHERFKW